MIEDPKKNQDTNNDDDQKGGEATYQDSDMGDVDSDTDDTGKGSGRLDDAN